jgi:putative flippase GtrA
MHNVKIEAAKFVLVGAANFLLTLTVFTTMLKIFLLNYLISLGAAWIFGMVFSYVLNFVWVFQSEQKIEFKARFFRFLLASVCSIGLNMLALSYVVDKFDYDPIYVQTLLMPLIVAINFSTAKFWSLRQV